MSDHAWVLENLASHVAGGLDTEERDRLEEHAAGCPDCARALDEARAVDRRLEDLFASVRPNPALEDRSIRALRQVPRAPGFWRVAKLLLGAAAVVLLALIGFGASALSAKDGLLFPGEEGPQDYAYAGEDEAWQYRSYLPQQSQQKQRQAEVSAPSDSGGDIKNADGLAEELREQLHSAKPFYGSVDYDGADVPGLGTGTMDTYPRARTAPPLRLELPPPPDETRSLDKVLKDGASELDRLNIHQFREHSKDGTWGYFRPGDDFQKTPPKDESREQPKADGESGESKQEQGQEKLPEGANRLHYKSTGGIIGPKSKQEKLPEGADKGKGAKVPGQEQPPATTGRKLIRSGDMEFEVDSFDAAVATITRLIGATKGGFIATINSDKLANGKVRGSVVVRVPPDQLDRLLLDLRKELGKTGELKGQRIGSEDITKKYIDFESELRSNRAMEERLLKIIRDGKGTIKDLVVAEEALGKYRTQIERLEGELRYYANLVTLCTLTINLTEKEIRVAAALTERERVQAGIEVEDVDKALREALTAVTEAKGRIRKSELKQHSAGQYSADLEFEVAPEKAGPLRDRLRQLGTMARLEINRVLHAEGGVLALKDGKVQSGPTQFSVHFYNLANVEPRETLTLKIAAPDVPAAFRKLRDVLALVEGHVKNMQLSEQDQQNITAHLDFDVRRAKEGALQTALAEAGVVLTRQLSRSEASENVTDAKVGYKVELVPTTAILPRELMTLALVANDVDATMTLFQAQVKEAHGRAGDPVFTREADGRVTARRIFIVPLAAAQGLFERFKSAGQVRVEQVKENAQAPEGKLAVARIDVTLSNTAQLVPADEGLWAQVRHGLSFSLRALFTSASWLIFGVLVVLPWLLVVLVFVWVVRRLVFGSTAAVVPVTVAPAGGGTAPVGG